MRYLWRKTSEKSEYFWTKLMERAVLPAGVFCYRLMGRPLSAPLRFYWISQGHWRALARYTFKPFPGKITLVRAIDRGPEVLGRREDRTLGWGSLAGGGVEVIDVPTEHMHMLFEPYVANLRGETHGHPAVITWCSPASDHRRYQGNLSRTSFNASSAVANVPSNCASSAARSISRNALPARIPPQSAPAP